MSRRDFEVAILFNVEDDIPDRYSDEYLAFQYTTHVSQEIERALRAVGYRPVLIPASGSLDDLRRQLSAYSPEHTFIFNNCDGFDGRNMGACEALDVMERLGFRHSGATFEAMYRCTMKSLAKQHFLMAGLATPPYQIFERPKGTIRLKFPLIVKPSHEDASLGIDLGSVVTTPAELYQRIDYVIERYRQSALVEEFVAGRELAVALWGNETVEVLPPSEDDYAQIADPLQRLITYADKWTLPPQVYRDIKVRCPAPLSSAEYDHLRRVAVGAYRAMGLRDYGRVDLRYRDGVFYVIDVNELPCLSTESGFWVSSQAAGYSYNTMIERIITLALTREGWI